MITETQSSTHSPNRGAAYYLLRVYLCALVVVVLLAEVIAIILIFKRQELHLYGIYGIAVFVFPLLVLMPGLTGMNAYWQFKKDLAAIAPTKDVPQASLRTLLTTVIFAYGAIVLVLIVLADCLRDRAGHF